MYRRFTDLLIVLWGITACLLMAEGPNAFAAPGDCNTDCRMVSTVGSVQGGKTVCRQFMYPDCLECVTNGCWSDLPKHKDPKCKADITLKQKEDTDLVCAILCNTCPANKYCQAATNETDFTYEEKIFVNKCMPETGGL